MDSPSLKDINQELDDELEKVDRMRQSLEEWAGEQRQKLNQYRYENLKQGQISLTEIKNILDLVQKYDSLNTKTKEYIIQTFKDLCHTGV